MSRGWAKASACCFHICLSSAILCYMVPFGLLRLSNDSPVFLWVFFSRVSMWWYIVHQLFVFCWHALLCPGPLPTSDLFLHVCDLCLFYYPDVCFSVPVCMFTYSFPSLFVLLLASSLLGWWVPMFPRRMSFLKVRMSCRRVSSLMFQCYPGRCSFQRSRSGWC